MCYCEARDDTAILRDIQQRNLPADALKRTCCWGRICAVRQHHHRSITPTTWLDIWDEASRVRGALFTR